QARIEISYVPAPSTVAELSIESCKACDSIYSESCLSVVTDTTFNPYTAGVLGNWRANRSYTYYGPRAQSDPALQTNIRTDGAYADFTPFWDFDNNRLLAQYDTTRWVWNSEMTLFNRK